MSFYKGDVAKLFCGKDKYTWEVVGVQYIDTACNENIKIDFSSGSVVRTAFVPVTWIENFSATTRKVKHTFDTESLSEKWQAQ
jgi:hypothetical protein